MPPGKRPDKGWGGYNPTMDRTPETDRSKGKSAAVRRAIEKGRMQGKAGRKIQEDEMGFNPQTMGNRKYKTTSPAYRALSEAGEARVQETPQGRKQVLGAKIPSGPIQRRMARKNTKSRAVSGRGGYDS